MAKNKLTFLANIKREGEAGSIRGKIPAGLIKAIGAKEGQGIEFLVHGTTLVGATVLSSKEFKAAQKVKDAEAPVKKAPVKRSVEKSEKKGKKVAPIEKTGKKPKPVTKPSKRRTEVEYEEPKKLKKGKKNKKGKFISALRS